ncbi:MAG TPA: FAD-dependent oxidoreductase [Gemmatimonadales bacterium]|nr:FAD-dependent oxidoreductase [Gemmatimonadales bacterium]
MPTLTGRERLTLTALCDTFVPQAAGGGHWLWERVLRVVEDLPDPEAFARLKLLLGALDQPLVNLALSGRPRPFASLDHAARVSLLRGWAESRIQARRAGFQALKRLVCVPCYAAPPANGRHRIWDETGYPGPLPMPDSARTHRRLSSVAIDGDTTLEADAVIIGSGAGGGVVAGVLAQQGWDVVVLEKGENLGSADYSHVELDGLRRGYLDGGLVMTRSGSLPILAGSCVGGGTAINWTTCFPLRAETREQWARASGLDLFTSDRFELALARVSERIGVNTDNSIPGPRDLVLERGLKALGWPVGVIPRNAVGCPGIRECGYCGYGCRHGAKQGTDATYLRDAVECGARLIERCEARTVLREAGRACGVDAVVRPSGGGSFRLTVRSRVVISAAGALHTPALLARSGLRNRHIGRRLFLHPVTAVMGRFDERIEPWTGCQQTRYTDHFAFRNGGYGALMETGAVHFALPASAYGWESPESHRADMAQLAHTGLVGILLRDRDPGRVVTGKDGRPRAVYELSAFDEANLRTAMLGAAEILAAAGAREIFTLQQPPARVRPSESGWRERYRAAVERRLGGCRMGMISFHQMGTAPMAATPEAGVVDERGECFELPGLFVADASLFPLSSGVNPMLTIMALADCVARGMGVRGQRSGIGE